MSTEEFPPNSDKSKLGEKEEKRVDPVVNSPVVRRKRSLGKRFRDIFFSGDAKSALAFGFYDTVVPGARELLFDFGRDTLEKLIMGTTRRQRNMPPSGPGGYVTYNMRPQTIQRHQMSRTMSRGARVRHDFDEIILETRRDAEEVLERLYDLVSQHGSASVGDLYDLVGVKASHTDEKWGWEDLHGADVTRTRGGYLLDLPNPEPLN